MAKVEESIKKDIRDYAFLCCHEDRNQIFNIEIFIGPDPADTSSYRKERAIEYVIADDYLKNLLEKKIIKKYFLKKRESKHFKGLYSSIRAHVSLRPTDAIRFY